MFSFCILWVVGECVVGGWVESDVYTHSMPRMQTGVAKAPFASGANMRIWSQKYPNLAVLAG